MLCKIKYRHHQRWGRTYTYTHNTKTKNRQDVVYRLPAFKMMEAEAVAAHYNKPTYIRNKNRLQCGQQALLLKNAGYSQHQLLLYPTLTERLF